MTLLRFPSTAGATEAGWLVRREPPSPAGAVLVITAPDQGSLPNLGVAGLRAIFVEGFDAWDGAMSIDLVLICAGARKPAELQGGLRKAQARGVPVIVWGEFTTEERIAMLEAGVQDVLSADCHPQEFRARLQVQLRRRTPAPGAPSWRLVLGSRSLIAPDGAVIHFSAGLTQILHILLEAGGEVVKREDLAAALYERLTNRALDAQVCRLRQKLRRHGCRMSLQGVKGLGYSLRFLDGAVIIEHPAA